MKQFLAILGIIASFEVAAVQLTGIEEIKRQNDCFRAPFTSFEDWIKMLSRRPNFSLERFPFKKETFEHFQNNLTCIDFSYDVDGTVVDGYVIFPKSIEMPLPTIIYNRGGNTHFGRVNFGKMMYSLMPIASEGFVVIGSQYRWSGIRKARTTLSPMELKISLVA